MVVSNPMNSMASPRQKPSIDCHRSLQMWLLRISTPV